MKREKTDSITHLVKIVAGEVFKSEVGETVLYPMIERVAKRVCKEEMASEDFKEKHLASEMIRNIKSNLEKAGDPWDKKEDMRLEQEIIMSIAQIAKNHGRSRGSIIARIKQKDLFY